MFKRYAVRKVGYLFQVVDGNGGQVVRSYPSEFSANSLCNYMNNVWIKNRVD